MNFAAFSCGDKYKCPEIIQIVLAIASYLATCKEAKEIACKTSKNNEHLHLEL